MNKEKRECGSCSLCCRIMAVDELNKPKYTWCLHVAHHSKCGIYETRPEGCRKFECLWLQGALLFKDKPNKIHCVFTSAPDSRKPVVQIFEGYKGASGEPRVRQIIKGLLRSGMAVSVIFGEVRTVVMPPGYSMEDTGIREEDILPNPV